MEEIRQQLKAKKAVGMSMGELKKWLDDKNLDIGFEIKGGANGAIGSILDAMKEGKVKFRTGAQEKEAKSTSTESEKVLSCRIVCCRN